MTPARETAALVERLRNASWHPFVHNEGVLGELLAGAANALDELIAKRPAASLLSRPPQPQPQGTASERETAERIVLRFCLLSLSAHDADLMAAEIASALAGEREKNAKKLDERVADLARDIQGLNDCGRYVTAAEHSKALSEVRDAAAAIRAGGQEG